MGSESHGKVWGLGRGVTARDMRNLRHQDESPLIMKLMKKMQNLENQVDVLNAKLATQASATQPESVSILISKTYYLPFCKMLEVVMQII